LLTTATSLGPTPDGFVTLKVWTWAGVQDVRVARDRFEDTYFGAHVAFF
jgi:hypothetical protein